MLLTNKEFVLDVHRQMGKADALSLRERAASMTPTEIIEEEIKIPYFNPNADYTNAPIGTPVVESVDGEWQVFTLLQPHNAAFYAGSTPSNTRSLWSLAHTKNPKKAKAWVAPLGTSGMYMEGECCKDSGEVYRSRVDDNPYSPSAYPAYWDKIDMTEVTT